jgi:hypothetical protein
VIFFFRAPRGGTLLRVGQLAGAAPVGRQEVDMEVPLTLESFARRLGRAQELPGDRWEDVYRFSVTPEGCVPGLIVVAVLQKLPAREGRVRWVLVVRP